MVSINETLGSMELTQLKSKYDKPKTKVVSGYKLGKLRQIMYDLEQTMIKAGADNKLLKQFEFEFLTSNGVSVPDIFLTIATQFSIGDYITARLVPSDKNITAKLVYEDYKNWCKLNNVEPLGKHEVIQYLKREGLLCKTGTVEGSTAYNVLLNTTFRDRTKT